MASRGPHWSDWVDDLAHLARRHLDGWELRPDGPATHGSGTLVLPVRTATGVAAVLKIGFPADETEHEHLVLRRWAGDGAVRLLRADPGHRVLLLERLRPQNLDGLSDLEACEVVARLDGRIHLPAMPQLDSLSVRVAQWIRDFDALPRGAPIPHRLVEQATTHAHDLIADAEPDGRVLHGHLHYGTVLAADREPWLAIAPRPVNGDPHYELAPMLWHRWDELAGHVRDGVRARLYALVDAAGLDEDRARAWALVRVVREAMRELDAGPRPDNAGLTRYVALAKAVQD